MSHTRREFDPQLDLVLERTVDVPRHLVWRAWTEPELLTQWFTPAPWTTPEAEIELEPGGIFRTLMRSPEGEEQGGTGCILEVVKDAKLVWTGALGPGFRPVPVPEGVPVFTAVITLESVDGGTKYRALVLHGDEEGRRKHEAMGFQEGWGAALDQLVALVRTLPQPSA
jgi:uncharacterized protein YndB with AHSA1/START domain